MPELSSICKKSFVLFLLAMLPATLSWTVVESGSSNQQANAVSKSGRIKLGVALSGGGARGLAHIGVLKVMEEAGLSPDYITGTSMGSVVGALYASGYSAAQIEQLVLQYDLNAVIQDQVSRHDRSVKDKKDTGKFLVTIPIERGEITLPKGLIAGQNVTLLFSKLFFSVRDVHDFHKLPIPFECMATDIVTGQDVIMDHGDLVQAVRTSMAIPSVFTPVEMDGRLLVDGGVSRNLPVSNLYDMGADITIAVDVYAFLQKREKLNNLGAIFDQGSAITSRPAAVAQAKRSDMVIEPNVVDFSIAGFDQAKDIIKQGEIAARAKLPELLALAKRLGPAQPRPVKAMPNAETDYVRLADIQFQGLKEVPQSYVKEQLGIKPYTRVSVAQIESTINRLYGSGNFINVRYELKPAKDGEDLVLHMIESLQSGLRFGIHYDSELKAMLLLNATFQNMALSGGELAIDAYLSAYPILKGTYLFHPGWGEDVSLGLRANVENGELSIYDNGDVQAYSKQKASTFGLIAQSSVSNVMIYGVALEKEVIYLNGLTPESLAAQGLALTESLNGQIYARLDTLDNSFYPRSGTLIEFKGNWLTDYMPFYDTPSFLPFGQATLNLSQNVPLTEEVAVSGGFRTSGTFGTPVNQSEYYFVGGMTSVERHRVPFLGTNLIQAATPNVGIGELGVQWELMKSTYLLLRGNIGWTGQVLNEVFTRDSMMIGYGATLGMLTPIGPLEATLMSSNIESGMAGFINLGYRF